MSIKAIVVDDEPLARARLKRLLGSKGVEVIAEGINGKEAVDLCQRHPIEIVFIDINMPIMSGLDAAKAISELEGGTPAIVFCTAYDEFAIEAFKTNATAYLLKPIQSDDIAAAIEKAISVNRLQQNHLDQEQVDVLSIHYKSGLHNMPLYRFRYFYSVEKSVFAVLDSGEEILVDRTLKSLESEYPSSLTRAHRSTLLVSQHAEALHRDQSGQTMVTVKDCSVRLPVSRRHLSDVKKCFQ